MRILVLTTALAGVGLALLRGTPSGVSTEAGRPDAAAFASTREGVSQPASDATLTEVVQRYCVTCHNDQLLTGNVSLQAFDVERAGEKPETAERMIRKLRAGMMPPPGTPRPGGDTLTVLVGTLETRVDAAARTTANLGQRRFQRITRAEYQRVIHDLLGLEVDPAEWLPPDVLVGSFDNASAGQPLSTTLLDAYMRAASEVSWMAIGNPDAVSVTAKYRNPVEVSQHAWDRLEGAPYGTRGGIVIAHDFPADGEYVFQFETTFGEGTPGLDHDIDVSVADEAKALVPLEYQAGTSNPVKTEPVFVRAGQQKVAAAFVRKIEGPYDDRFRVPEWSSANLGAGTYGITALPHITELLITGPVNVTGVSENPVRDRIFTCRPSAPAQERGCAESILRSLATKAYRRPVAQGDLTDLMAFYDQGAAEGGFEAGVRTGLEAILAAPEFLFRFEHEPENAQPGQSYRLSDIDLATRLSFFLWASAPDQQLLDVAAAGRLSNEDELERQVRRMLADSRADALATRFVHQWLRLQDVGADVWPVPFYYPDFSQQLADAMVTETELFFSHLVREDKSLLELFNADYTFLNERLAKHYDIPGVAGDEFRLVKYPTDQRRGILGHGSVLLLTSVPDRTSPVIRGKWVMQVLMGTPPPPPPPNVPAFATTPAAGAGRLLTTRERMEAHRKSPTCNACHRFIDPIGLALDNFDVAGRWRVRENMAPLDTRGEFYDGTVISKPTELIDVLLKRPIPLVRNFTNNLLSYALGRPTEYYDQPTVRAIASAAETDGYKLSSIIMGVVKSDPFLMRQVQATAN
jgi:hypothetical protein